MTTRSQLATRTHPHEMVIAPTACQWGMTMYGECRPFSYISNIPFQLRGGAHFTIDQLIPIFSDARFVNWSVTLTTPGLNGQRIMRASKIYPNSFRLLYWNAYEKYRPGNRISAERISSQDLLQSIQFIMAMETRTQELEIVDDETQERIYVFVKMTNLPPYRFYSVDAAGMLDQGSARGHRGGL